MKKILFLAFITFTLSACVRDRVAENRVTDNAHNFIEQIFNTGW